MHPLPPAELTVQLLKKLTADKEEAASPTASTAFQPPTGASSTAVSAFGVPFAYTAAGASRPTLAPTR